MAIASPVLAALVPDCSAHARATERSPRMPQAALTIGTAGGVIAGKALEHGVIAYLGIPYATPPLGDLRWRPPVPAEPWTGVLHADRFAPQCFQPMRSPRSNHYSGADAVSEDCLYLNVWTRAGLRDAPVMVYIHGGAFYSGSGSVGIYGGEPLAREGAVFVNMQYRVGPLGFLALPELRTESPHAASGNYGFLDQIAALRWVQRNIARFGGNPHNVTIIGQSAGSMSVLTLQASPLAKGLFQRAVGMSGAMVDGAIAIPPREDAEAAGEALKAVWKAGSLSELRALPADRLVVPRNSGGPSVGPSIDGYVLPSRFSDIFQARQHSDVPVLLGYTRDEALGGIGAVRTLAAYRDRSRQAYGDAAERLLELYPAHDDETARSQARVADRDATIVTAMFGWASLQRLNGTAAVYSYQFSRPHAFAKGATFSDLDPATAGAYHTSEVPFWLGTIDALNRWRITRSWTATDRAISRSMMQALLSFARTGRPQAPGMAWPQFALPQPELVEIADGMSVRGWPDAARLSFFRDFYGTANRERKQDGGPPRP